MQKLLRKLRSALYRPEVYRTLATGTLILVLYKAYKRLPPSVALTLFLTGIHEGAIKEIIDYGGVIAFRTVKGWARTNASILNRSDLIQSVSEKGIDYSASSIQTYAVIAAGALLLYGFLVSNFLKSHASKELTHRTNVFFSDIAGNQRAKQGLHEVIQFFNNPEHFEKVKAKLPRGILLYGPSGTGKTMLAKAVASEAGVNFIQCTGSEFIEMYVGVGARRIRDLFKEARKCSPCIVFIDEIDCLAVKRASGDRSHSEQHHTINQLLSEMDGFIENSRIVVLGATNNYTMMDEAILRPGRFDRKIEVNLPEQEHRFEILKLNLRGRANVVSEDFLCEVARDSEGLNGAELASIINEASFICLREHLDAINEWHVKEAFDELVNGKTNFQMEKLLKTGLLRLTNHNAS